MLVANRNRTVEQPLKIPFIAAIVLVANAHKPELTADVLKKIGEATQKHLDESSWREVKLFLRFLGCLQGLFEGDGVFGILEDLFSRAVDLQTQSSEDVRPPLCRDAESLTTNAVSGTRTGEDHSFHHSLHHGLIRDWI